MTSASLALLYLGTAAAGLAAVLIVRWRGWLSTRAIGIAAAALGATALIALVTTYEDDGCDQDTACRLLAEPSYLVIVGILPGVALGMIIVSAFEVRRSARARAGQVDDDAGRPERPRT